MTLYEIDRAIAELLENGFGYTVDEDTGEIIYDDRSDEMEKLQIDRNTKLEDVALYIKYLDALAEDIKAEEKALKKRREEREKKAENLRKYLTNSMTQAGEERLETGKVSISFRKSQAVIVDETRLDKAYIKEKVITEYSPDKVAIKAAIKAGKTVEGAYIEERKAVQIR